MLDLWKHQAIAIGMADQLQELYLAHEAGTGKTRSSIEILRRKYSLFGRVMRTVIFCPKVVMKNWKNEIGKYSKIDLNNVILLGDSEKKRVSTIVDQCFTKDGEAVGKILITNYESSQMKDLMRYLKHWRPEMIICDEIHRLKNHSSKRAKAVVDLADVSLFRLGLSGTPVLNSALDLFMQWRFLDLGKTFGKNYFAFRGMYFQDANAGWSNRPGHFPKWEPRPECYADLSQKIKRKTHFVKKSECLDLPPFVRTEIEVDLGPDQAKAYTQMRDEFIAYIEELNSSGQPSAVVAQLALTRSLRLQQILSGFAKTDDGKVHRFKNIPRLESLESLLEDYCESSKVIVWACFKENYAMIAEVCKKLSLKYAEIHGDIKDKDTQIEMFQQDPKCRVMIGNQGAGGIGINLVEANIAIYYSKGFSLEHDIQSEARCYRGGSERHDSVTRIDLVAKNTLDSHINIMLANKQQIGSTILTLTKSQI